MTNMEAALRLAAVYITRIPGGVPFALWADENGTVDLDITPRTPEEFWQLAHVLNNYPATAEGEIRKHVGSLHVSAYILPPLGKEDTCKASD